MSLPSLESVPRYDVAMEWGCPWASQWVGCGIHNWTRCTCIMEWILRVLGPRTNPPKQPRLLQEKRVLAEIQSLQRQKEEVLGLLRRPWGSQDTKYYVVIVVCCLHMGIHPREGELLLNYGWFLIDKSVYVWVYCDLWQVYLQVFDQKNNLRVTARFGSSLSSMIRCKEN